MNKESKGSPGESPHNPFHVDFQTLPNLPTPELVSLVQKYDSLTKKLVSDAKLHV